MENRKEYNCKNCVNKGSRFCAFCTTVVSPSNRTTRPTNYKEEPNTAFLRIRLNIKEPPLGIKPRYIHEEERAIELGEAINRYTRAKFPIPIEWVEEYNEIRARLKKRDDERCGGNIPR